jgi:GH24 family phage-related lysozyme (muramidase)
LEKEMSNEALASYWNSSVVKANGKELAGLVRRRRAESNLFFQA